MQGYLFSKPLPVDAVDAWIQSFEARYGPLRRVS